MLINVSSYETLPPKPGVYLFLGNKNEVLYVGKAKNLKKRVSSYFINKTNLLEKTKILVSQIEKIRYVIAESEIEALLLEANYIKQHKPKYNTRLADGKRYPLIRITIKDNFPKVLISRRAEDKNSLYFGPFPNSGAVRLVLRTIRRIFPFQSVINHPKKLCLYYHLGLCSCPQITNDKNYRKDIQHIVTFLKGNAKKALKDLENERNILSKSENFEKASDIQKKIEAIKYVTSPIFKKFEYKVNPNLETDLRNKELTSLKDCLNRHNTQINKLDRIECFDISNIAGTNATGSMVVFVNGEKDPFQYRRFKIRNLPNSPNLANDFAMMQQVISRRLSHKEWEMPDLIIVDGGKGQVSAALNAITAMKQLNNEAMEIPVIGLAKREETIVIPKSPNFIEISLPKNSPALHLLMRIRDEAHRFALSYHRKIRSRAIFE